ncbi:MAG: histidinol-phosphate transaminase [Clostridiales bacterium]|nr:histidinol-phosphate transaminase [Clostridiales bacterium]
MSKFFSYKYKNLTPYTPGEQPKEREYIKLNTNESPFPPSNKAIELAKAELSKLQLYPDPDVKELTALVAQEVGVAKECVIMTNGSDEILNFAFMAYCDNDNPAIFPDISYGFYKVFAEINNIPYKEIPLREDFSVCVDDYIGTKGTVFIANPNAPTGLNLPLTEIERLVKADTNRVVVIDEAYVDFGGDSAVKLVDKYDNLIVTQTFSKSRSMAGARLGFGVANKDIIADLMAIKYSTNPYNVNKMTAAAGVGAILDKEYFTENCRTIIENREWVKGELNKLGFSVTDSKTNFVFAKTDKIDGKKLYLALKDRGVLVRHFDKDKIKEYNRITIGTIKQMQVLINTIKSILEEEK